MISPPIVHIADSAIVGRVRHNDDQRPVEVAFVDSRSLAGVFEDLAVVDLPVAAAKCDTALGGSVEPVVDDGVDASGAGSSAFLQDASTASVIRINAGVFIIFKLVSMSQ